MVAKRSDDLLAVLDSLYAAAQRQDDWKEALGAVARLFEASAATVLSVDRSSGALRFFAGHNIPEAGLAEYRDHMIHLDPRLRYAESHPERDLFYDRLHHEEKEMDRDEYYAWLARVGDFRYYAAVRLAETAESSAFFTLQRGRNQGHVEEADLDLLRRLTPHLQRCAEMAITFGEADFRRSAAQEALHRLATATILLDESGRILFANAEAEKMLRAADLLAQRGERHLAAVSWRTNNRLQQIIGGALRDLGAPLQAVPREMVIDRMDRPPVTLRVIPLLARERPIFGPDAALVLFVHDPETATRLPASQLRARYGLTGAETQLCRALLEGLSVNAYAARTGISVDTVRSHLKRAMAKTGTDRQAGLVALLMREMLLTR